MKKISILLACLLITTTIWAQSPGDTITVQSLVHSSQTRDTMVSFPNLPNVTFEKIIMKYNMRCKNAQVSTGTNRNLGCGEWDYSCNTFVRDSTKADSTAHTTNNYIISGFTGTTLDYTTAPVNDYHRMIQPNVTVTSITSETQALIGAGNSNVPHTVPTASYGAKSQYLYTAAELSAAGATTGNLDGVLLTVNTAGLNSDFLKVKIKHSNKTQLSGSAPDTSGFTEVYFHNANLVTGPNRLQFHTPFNWDGTSNIIVEFSFTNSSTGASNVVISGSSSANPMGIVSRDENLYYFNGNNYIETDNYKGISGSNARTVEAWIKTSVADKEIVSWGRNAANVKWVFRVEGQGRLRVENGNGGIVGTTVLTDNEWHHVACTFNGADLNDVKLYVDGQLETNSSNSGTPINTDTAGGLLLRISRGVNNRYFDGHIDNVRIWNTDLSATTLQNWMHKELNLTHPNVANLRAYYQINAGNGNTISDQSGLNNNAHAVNGAIWQTTSGEKHFKDFREENARPNLTFVQGTYVTTTVNDTTWFAVAQTPHTVRQTIITPHPGTLMDDEVTYAPTNLYYNILPGERYYDDTLGLIQTLPVTSTGTVNIAPVDFIRRDPMDFQIMSFVTPYGIGIDFGQDGHTWTFDMTDFAPVLQGDKRMFLTFGGQWQEEMDIQFLFIVGTPPRDVIDINNIWKTNRSSTYTNINADNVFPPRNITLPSAASSFKIRTEITGHGQDGEFTARQHHLDIDGGADEFNWGITQECADNAIFPQGGTWIYDRQGWCPGEATLLKEFDLDPHVTPGQTHSFDYDVDVATGDSRYIVNHELVAYGAANHNLDLRITDIINPSTKIEYTRENPMCHTPKIVVQNTGSTQITSFDVDFWLNAGTKKVTQTITETLNYMESKEIELSMWYDFWDDLNGPTGNTFYAEVKNPNGTMDDYDLNDKMSTPIEVTNVFPNQFIIMYRANSAPTETKIEVIDDQGNVVFTKTATNSSLTYDTVTVGNGCHSILISDSDDDGIDFWANSDGAALLLFRDLNNSVIWVPEKDFGKYLRYNFTTNYPLSYDEIHKTLSVKVYPNPTDDILNIDGDNIQNVEVTLLNSVGKKITAPLNRNTNRLTLSTSSLANGMYFVELKKGEQRTTKKFMVSH